MRKRMMLLAGACCLLFACQSNEELQKVSQESNAPMFLEASIASGVLTSRTTTSEQGVSNFELISGMIQHNTVRTGGNGNIPKPITALERILAHRSCGRNGQIALASVK